MLHGQYGEDGAKVAVFFASRMGRLQAMAFSPASTARTRYAYPSRCRYPIAHGLYENYIDTRSYASDYAAADYQLCI